MDNTPLETEKKRGRPLKKKITDTQNKNENVENELILTLPLSQTDINNHNYTITIEELDNEIKELSNEVNTQDNVRQYIHIIKQLKEKNEKLEKYVSTISPMFNTEIKVYNFGTVEDESNKIIELTKTNICCLNCCHPFDNYPIFLPIGYANNRFIKMGNKNTILFCSFNCASSYNMSLNDGQIEERYRLLKLLYYKIYKNEENSLTNITIPLAPPKELLKMFGGDLSIEEYRLKSKILEKEYHKFLPPFIPSGYIIEEVIKNDNNIIFNHLVNNYPSSSKNLKRNKKVQNTLSKNIDEL